MSIAESSVEAMSAASPNIKKETPSVIFKTAYEKIEPDKLPDGRYPASWHGYQIEWQIGTRSFLADVSNGVRGWSHGWLVIENGVSRFER